MSLGLEYEHGFSLQFSLESLRSDHDPQLRGPLREGTQLCILFPLPALLWELPQDKDVSDWDPRRRCKCAAMEAIRTGVPVVSSKSSNKLLSSSAFP